MATVRGAFQQMALSETYVDEGKVFRVNDSLAITPSFGAIWYTSVDLGFPEVRASVQSNAQRDGTLDETQYTGARDVAIEGVVLNNAFDSAPARYGWSSEIKWNSASWWLSELSSWASPARRFRFYFTDETGRSRFLDVRGNDFSSTVDKDSDGYRNFQLGLTNPSGKIYGFATGSNTSADGRRNISITLSSTGDAGRAYPEIGPYDRDYPPANVGFSAIHYEGTVPNGCLIALNTGGGTMQAPRITFTAPDQSTMELGLSSALTIAAHTTLYIDTVERTVTTKPDNSSTVTNVATYLSAPVQWPQLKPGINLQVASDIERGRGYNRVGFTGTADVSATMNVLYYPADLF